MASVECGVLDYVRGMVDLLADTSGPPQEWQGIVWFVDLCEVWFNGIFC